MSKLNIIMNKAKSIEKPKRYQDRNLLTAEKWVKLAQTKITKMMTTQRKKISSIS